ncbi:hypothetical protein MTO96_011552 [Rhipicephalus appendiculatus]
MGESSGRWAQLAPENSTPAETRWCDGGDLTSLAGSGLYQNVLLVLSMYRGMMLAINNLCASFLFPEVDHWCAPPPAYEHWFEEEWKFIAIPRTSSVHGSMTIPCSGLRAQKCGTWCADSAWMNALPQSCYMAGLTAGFVIMGPFSDIYGRRPVLLWGIVSYIILQYILAVTPSFWLFCVLRFLNAIAVAAANNSMTLFVESVGPTYRGRSMVAYGIFWGVGIIVLTGIVHLVPKWQSQLAVFATMYALPLLLWRYIVESPKWLLTVGKYREADEAIRKIARMNGRKDIVEEDLSRLKNKYKEQHRNRGAKGYAGIRALFNSRTMIKFTVTNAIFQFCTALVRYQLALDTEVLPLNPYLNFLVGGVIEIVSGDFILTESLMMLTCRLCIGNVININIIYLSEIFPTGVRALATGFAQTVFGVGGAIQPFFNHPFGNGTWDAVFYAAIMLVATLAVFPWPETKGRPLPDFVENVEASASSSASGSGAHNTNGTGDIVVHYNPGYSANEEGAREGAVDIDRYLDSLTVDAERAVAMELASFDRVIGVRRSAGASAPPRGIATNAALKREHTL